jgi:two-component system sensor histidine kinase EvgS
LIEENANELVLINNEIEQARLKADEANFAKSMFIANVSHEIRTPMNSILGFSEILLNRIDDDISKSYLKTIFSSGKILLDLINDILDLSKIDSGKIKLNLTQFSLKDMIDEIFGLFIPRTNQKGIDLLLEFPSSFPGSIQLDEVRLRQILVNLIGNSLKFTEAGHIKVYVEINNYSINGDSIDFTISVEDTGIGISPEDQDLIFQPFSQARTNISKNAQGTGLGLTISTRLAEILGGNITLKSEIGCGSTFYINLNSVSNYSDQVIKQEIITKDFEKIKFEEKTILIVDDVQGNIELLKAFLSDQSFKFIESNCGTDAIEIVKKHKPDIVIMDIMMPKMTGIEAAEIIRADKSSGSIPIVAYTASSQKDHKADEMKIFDDILYKPALRNELISLLKKYIPFTSSDSKIIRSSKSSDITSSYLTESGKIVFNQSVEDFAVQFESKAVQILDVFDLNEMGFFIESIDKYLSKNDIPFFKVMIEKLKQAYKSFDIEALQKILQDLINSISEVKINASN